MPIYGGSVDAVAQYDRFREGMGAQQAQFLAQLGAQAGRELQDRKDRERQFQFALAKENADLAAQKERMKLERERLDEIIRANKEAEKYNFGRLDKPSASSANADMRRQEFIFKDLQDQADMGELPASRQEIEQLFPNGLPEQLESLHRRNQSARGELTRSFDFRRSAAERLNEESALRNMIAQEKELGAAKMTPRWLGGRSDANMKEWQGELDAMQPEMSELRGSPEFRRGGMVIPREGGGYDPADRPAFMGEPRFRFDLRPETLESIQGGGVPSAPQSTQRPAYMPTSGAGWNPEAARIVKKASELAEQRAALTNTIDQVESSIPSFLLAPPELHGQIKDARKQGKDLLRNLSTEQKDIEKRLEDLRKEAADKADKEKEQGKKSVDTKQFSFGALLNMFQSAAVR